jgi:serine/threonine protein kinase
LILLPALLATTIESSLPLPMLESSSRRRPRAGLRACVTPNLPPSNGVPSPSQITMDLADFPGETFVVSDTDHLELPPRYAPQQLLRQDNLGPVYRAIDLDSNTRESVSIKIICSDARTPHIVARFTQEVQAQSALSHPGIAAIRQVGVTLNNNIFVVMDDFDGEPLKKVIDEGALHPNRAIKLSLEILSALDAAHQNDVFHRDLRPDNILVDSQRSRIQIIDFRFAKQVLAAAKESENADSISYSKENRLAAALLWNGPKYLAPEQITMGPPDPRTDLYAFGLILFELLVGRHPFATAMTDSAMLEAHLQQSVPSVALFSPLLNPATFDPIFARLLAKEPKYRYESVAAVTVALQQLLSLGERR